VYATEEKITRRFIGACREIMLPGLCNEVSCFLHKKLARNRMVMWRAREEIGGGGGNERSETGTAIMIKKFDAIEDNTGCLKKRFTTLKAYVHLLRGHVRCFELS
jgi:hypothetical protein